MSKIGKFSAYPDSQRPFLSSHLFYIKHFLRLLSLGFRPIAGDSDFSRKRAATDLLLVVFIYYRHYCYYYFYYFCFSFKHCPQNCFPISEKWNCGCII